MGKKGLGQVREEIQKKEKLFWELVKMLAYKLNIFVGSSFCVTLTAINWPAAIWLEWNFAFLSAVSAGCLVHLFVIHFCYFNSLYHFRQKSLFANSIILRTQY